MGESPTDPMRQDPGTEVGPGTSTGSRDPRAQPTSRRRGRRRRLLDAAVARALSMPLGRHDYALTSDIPVRMRDGVVLLADVYEPVDTSGGTILIRTPYGRNSPVALLTAGYYATHGFTVVNQSCRGTAGSGGDFDPFVAEVDDGADTVVWLREQRWFDGRFALCGASYLGYTAWAIMTDPPPELACAVIAVSAHDNYGVTYRAGVFALEATLGLLDGFTHLGDPMLLGLLRFPLASRRLAPAFTELPLLAARDTVLAGRRTRYASWLQAQGPDDPVWQTQRLDAALDRVSVPVLLHEGWVDPFPDQMLAQYARLRGRGVDVGITIGGWTHMETGTKAARVLMPETLEWLAAHLSGTGTVRRPNPVRVFVTGAETWRDLPDWPPPSEGKVLYLRAGGALSESSPGASEAPSAFRYDPADPTPSVGGQVVNPAVGGRRDNRRLEARPDVLTFTGPVLEQPLEVIGTPVVDLVHHSDNPYVDLFVRLCEVHSDGRSTNLADGYRRLDTSDPTRPAEPTQPTDSAASSAESGGVAVTLPLDALAHRFATGSRIRLQVSGGAHPRFARNLGTGGDPATSTALASSQRTIFHGTGGVSRLVLPRPARANP